MKNHSLWRSFRAFYYPQTHLPAVDLTRLVQENTFRDPSIVSRAQKVTEVPEVRCLLSTPLAFDKSSIQRHNFTMEKHRFKLLASTILMTLFANGQQTSTTIPSYSVLEHPELEGWIIKATGQRLPDDRMSLSSRDDYNEEATFHPQDGTLRLAMNARIRQVAKAHNLGVFVPLEDAVSFAEGEGHFILSEKLDIMTKEETIERIRAMPSEEQTCFAHQLAQLIDKIGYADASFDNIRFLKNSTTLAIIDTEALGLFNTTSHPSPLTGHSVEKCARVGLFKLKTLATEAQLETVAAVAETFYRERVSSISIKKILISIFCPLIPLVLLIRAFVRFIFIMIAAIEFAQQMQSASPDNPASQRSLKEARDVYLYRIKGIPFPEVTVPG